jgi:hypothetical protein
VRARWLLAWLAGLPVILARAGDLHESDTFWQVRAGLLILDEGRLPTVDTFSWTADGRHWELNSWGFDVALAVAYRFGAYRRSRWSRPRSRWWRRPPCSCSRPGSARPRPRAACC